MLPLKKGKKPNNMREVTIMVKDVTVYLDDNELEFTDNEIRCGFIVSRDNNGEETLHHDLLDNKGYYNVRDLVGEVAGLFRVRREVVLVN